MDMSKWPEMSELDRPIFIAECSCLVKHGCKGMTDGSDPRTTPLPPCRLFAADDLASSKNKCKKKKAKYKQQADAAAAPNLRTEEHPRGAVDQSSEYVQPKTRREVSHKVPIEAQLEVRATNSAADMATRHKRERDVLEGGQETDVDFPAGASLPKGAAQRTPSERAHKHMAFKFQANDFEVPTRHPPTIGSAATALNPTPSVTATVDVQRFENEVRGVISDVRVLKDFVAPL